jgi:hypothetical protein
MCFNNSSNELFIFFYLVFQWIIFLFSLQVSKVFLNVRETSSKSILKKDKDSLGRVVWGWREAEIKSWIFDMFNLSYQWDIQSRCKLDCWKFQIGTQRREVGC